MKIIDFALVFAIIIICFIVPDCINNRLIFENTMYNAEYNNIMDDIVMDSLNHSFISVDNDGKPVVDRDMLSSRFLNEMSFVFSNGSINEAVYGQYIILIYTIEDGFYVFCNNEWSEKIEYSFGNLTKQEGKVNELLCYINDTYKISLSIPKNENIEWLNTIKDYSLVALYKSKKISIDFNQYYIYTISGAMLRNHSTESTT